MEKYRLVGGEANVGRIRMERFGQAFAIEDKLAKQAIKAGVHLLTESQFKEIGFTSEQLKIWADPFMPLFDVPVDPAEAADKEDFLRKREAAHAKFSEVRQGLLASLAAAEVKQPETANKKANKE